MALKRGYLYCWNFYRYNSFGFYRAYNYGIFNARNNGRGKQAPLRAERFCRYFGGSFGKANRYSAFKIFRTAFGVLNAFTDTVVYTDFKFNRYADSVFLPLLFAYIFRRSAQYPEKNEIRALPARFRGV